MTIRRVLQELYKFLPNDLVQRLQYLNSSLVFNLILRFQSQPSKLNLKPAMVFSPHQDDETLGCGGMIALKREKGVPVTVVFLTDGQGSGGSMSKIKEEIIQIRKQEAQSALSILGVDSSDVYFLDKPDGSLRDLLGESKQKTIEQIIELLKKYKPQEVYVPHYKDCHRDHEATYTLVKEAIAQLGVDVDLLQYPIWIFWRAPLFIMLQLKDIAAARKLSITEVQSRKQQAIASYCSQMQMLPRQFLNRFLGSYEIFFKVEL
ncbi:MAG: PIG-L family deacetylase [Calothrix sp. C42_A2020_038]|nr:PIG-L family deacetylase [Calothrix sp. C42_A2020_038]